MSFSNFITKIGTTRLSEALGVDKNHIRMMRTRDSIPSRYWTKLVLVFPEVKYSELASWAAKEIKKNERPQKHN